jgi:hypothetical protein
MNKSDAMKETLKQVKQEVDRWPSWMKTSEVKETSRQSSDPQQKLSK